MHKKVTTTLVLITMLIVSCRSPERTISVETPTAALETPTASPTPAPSSTFAATPTAMPTHTSAPTSSPTPTHTSTPVPAAVLPTLAEGNWPTVPHLTVEEYALKDVPQLDPLVFEPVQGSAKEILQKRRAERERRVGRPGAVELSVTLGEDRLVATAIHTDTGEGQVGAVEVTYGGSVIYTVPLGQASPVDKLRGLWVHDGHWYLEVGDWQGQGQVIQDGESLNERCGYEETFGFQLLHGRPFYFFRREGQIGVFYEGQEILLRYEYVPHYGCCSAAAVNPVQAENMVAFFGLCDGTWYYVEMGAYE